MGTYQKPSQGPEPSNTKHRPISLPRVHTADEATRPLGQGSLQAEDMNFDIMVDMRRAHQTKQAATGAKPASTWVVFADIYRKEGLAGINKGVNAVALRQATNWGSRYVLYASFVLFYFAICAYVVKTD